MNPQTPNQDDAQELTPPIPTPSFTGANTAQPVAPTQPIVTPSLDEDAVALQAIDALESETQGVPEIETPQPQKPVEPTQSVPSTPQPYATPLVPLQIPVKPARRKAPLVAIAIVGVVVIGVAAGYVIWQSLAV